MARLRAGWIALAYSVGVVGAGFFGCDQSEPEPPQDTDKDGLSNRDEQLIYGTSPVLADTDGDGLSDQVEIVKYAFDPANAPYRFNPRVADVPVPGIVFVGPPVLTLQLIDTTGEVRTFTTTQTAQRANTVSTSVLNQVSTTNTLTNTRTVTQVIPARDAGAADAGAADAGARDGGDDDAGEPDAGEPDAGEPDAGEPDRSSDEGELAGDDSESRDRERGPTDAGDREAGAPDAGARDAGARDAAAAPPSGPITIANAVSVADANQRVFGVTNLESATFTDTFAEADSYSESHAIAATTGVLQVPAILENRGHVAFKLTNLMLGATLVNGGVTFPVGNLVFDTPYNTFLPLAVGPGERTDPIVFDKELITLDTARAVLSGAEALVVSLNVSDLSNAEGRPFAFDLMEIRTKTATVEVDYAGLLPSERFDVATNLDPSKPGITARRALEEILRIPIATSTSGLDAVREIGAGAIGAGAWSIELVHDDGARVVSTFFSDRFEPYDFDSIRIVAGDVLELKWSMQ